jgi:hypothetical protein
VRQTHWSDSLAVPNGVGVAGRNAAPACNSTGARPTGKDRARAAASDAGATARPAGGRSVDSPRPAAELRLCVGDRDARADRQRGKLIDGIAPGALVRELLFIEPLRHPGVPFTGFRPDHRARIELAAIDPHRAAEAAADLERRLDNGVAREARWDRLEIRDFPGRRAIPSLLGLGAR